MDKRRSSRVDFKIEAVFSYKGMHNSVKVKNLSLGGLLVETDKRFDLGVGEKLDVKLLVRGQTSNLEINAQGILVRKESGKAGLKFNVIDLDSFIHLRNIIAYNNGDYDKIMEEFFDATTMEIT